GPERAEPVPPDDAHLRRHRPGPAGPGHGRRRAQARGARPGGGRRPRAAGVAHPRRPGALDRRPRRRGRPGLSATGGAAPPSRRQASLRDSAERVRRSIRHRLLFANVAGAGAVMTFLQLASGRDLAPDLPLWGRVLGPALPVLVLLVPAYLWGHRAFGRAIA